MMGAIKGRALFRALFPGGTAPFMADPAESAHQQGPDTVDGIAPAGSWRTWWQAQVLAKREGAPWIENPKTKAPA